MIRACLLLALFSAPSVGQDLYDLQTIRSLNLTFHQDGWWAQLVSNYNRGQRDYIPADLEVDGTVYQDVGVRLRGKAAYLWSNQFKKPFKIKMDAFVPDQELYDYDSIRLNNGSEDPTFCREVIMTNTLRDYMPMPRANFVVLTINGESWGVYANEQQKDRRFLNEWFKEGSGNRYKSVLGGNLSYLGPDRPPYEALYENQAADDPEAYQDLIELCDVLNNTDIGDELIDALWDVINMDGAVMMFAADCTFGNFDSYYFNRNNYYIMGDDQHDQLHIINHDLNLAFGTWANYPSDLTPEYRLRSNLIPFCKRPLEVDWMRRQYFAHIRTLLEELFRLDVMQPLLEEYMNLIRTDVYADPKKNFTNEDFENNVTLPVLGYSGSDIPGVLTFVTERYDFLSTFARIDVPVVQVDQVTNLPACPTGYDSVAIQAMTSGTVPVGAMELRWRSRGPFLRVAMFDDGAHEDGFPGDGIYGAVIPPQSAGTNVEYYVMAMAGDDTEGINFFPSAASHAPHTYRVEGEGGPRTIINELMASNDSVISDEAGEFDDWLEMVNIDVDAVDLSGTYLTDDLDAPMKFVLPAGTIIAPGETLLVWADNDPEQGPLHAPFRLDADGEEIALFDTDGLTLLDSFVFGPQITDQSTGRLFDGGSEWVRFPESTPELRNQPNCGVRPFAPLRNDANIPLLSFEGVPRLSESVALVIDNGEPFEIAALVLGMAPDQRPFWGDDFLLIDPATIAFSAGLRLDGQGDGVCAFRLPDDIGSQDTVYFQAIILGTPPTLTNAIELTICL